MTGAKKPGKSKPDVIEQQAGGSEPTTPAEPQSFEDKHGCTPEEWLAKAPSLSRSLANELKTQEATFLVGDTLT